jgi:F-type H+-transporting ATPase subunit delta
MIETKVARRYAKSLIDLANEKGVLDAVNKDMKMFVEVCSQNRDLALVLSNPIVHSDKKLNILRSIFSDKMNKMTIAFFEIVIRKTREKYLIQIAKEFTEQYKYLKGIQTAEIISAVGLDDKLRKQVYEMLRNNNNSEVELIEKVDKNLIGGFVLRIDDRQYDASIASDLRKLTQAFSANPYIKKN